MLFPLFQAQCSMLEGVVSYEDSSVPAFQQFDVHISHLPGGWWLVVIICNGRLSTRH